ncbi:MAG: hypothetical protein AAF630_06980 [Cyanobacteria bacterium P01_C01_bin.38]
MTLFKKYFSLQIFKPVFEPLEKHMMALQYSSQNLLSNSILYSSTWSHILYLSPE